MYRRTSRCGLAAPSSGSTAPVELRRALTTIDRTIDTYTNHARLGTAA